MGELHLGLISGTRTRSATIVALFLTLMLERRLPELLDGGDNITRLALCYTVFLLPAGARAERRSLAVWLHNMAVVAIMAQLIVLYGTSGIMKAAGDRWHHGTALYQVTQVEWFSEPWVRPMFRNALVVTLATYSTLLFQLWFPMAIFSRFKLGWLAFGILMHFNIAVVMGLISFSTVMIGLELFLVTDEEWTTLAERARATATRLGFGRAAAPELAVYYDGHCALCVASIERLRRLDGGGRLALRSFRHQSDYLQLGLDAAALEKRMHVVRLADGDVAAGFAAVQRLARALWPLWPLRSMLCAVGVLGLAERAYDFMAARRRIVPDGSGCTHGRCPVPVPAEREVA